MAQPDFDPENGRRITRIGTVDAGDFSGTSDRRTAMIILDFSGLTSDQLLAGAPLDVVRVA